MNVTPSSRSNLKDEATISACVGLPIVNVTSLRFTVSLKINPGYIIVCFAGFVWLNVKLNKVSKSVIKQSFLAIVYGIIF